MTRRILVAYDGSDGGRRALDRAIAEAHGSKARITVLSVAEVPLDPNVPRNFGSLDDISPREGGALPARQTWSRTSSTRATNWAPPDFRPS